MQMFGAKHPDEIANFEFDMGAKNVIPTGVTISSAVVTVSRVRGEEDGNPSAMILGAATFTGRTVTQKIGGGVNGATYLLTFTATGSDGGIYVAEGGLFVKSPLPIGPA